MQNNAMPQCGVAHDEDEDEDEDDASFHVIIMSSSRRVITGGRMPPLTKMSDPEWPPCGDLVT